MLDAQRAGIAERNRHSTAGGLRVDPRLAVAVPFALESGHGIVGPDRAHGRDALAHGAVAAAERHVGTMVGQLLLVPADAHAQHHTAAGQHVGAGDGAGEVDEVVLEDEADAGAQRDPAGPCGGDADGDEGVHHVEVGAGELAAVRVGALAGRRDVRVLGVPHRGEAAFFEFLREIAWVDAAVVIACQVSELHGAHPREHGKCAAEVARLGFLVARRSGPVTDHPAVLASCGCGGPVRCHPTCSSASASTVVGSAVSRGRRGAFCWP